MNTFEQNRAAMRYLSNQLPRLSERSHTSVKKIGLGLEMGLLTLVSGTPAPLVFLGEVIRQAFTLAKLDNRREAIIRDMRNAGVSRDRIKHLLDGGK